MMFDVLHDFKLKKCNYMTLKKHITQYVGDKDNVERFQKYIKDDIEEKDCLGKKSDCEKEDECKKCWGEWKQNVGEFLKWAKSELGKGTLDVYTCDEDENHDCATAKVFIWGEGE